MCLKSRRRYLKRSQSLITLVNASKVTVNFKFDDRTFGGGSRPETMNSYFTNPLFLLKHNLNKNWETGYE